MGLFVGGQGGNMEQLRWITPFDFLCGMGKEEKTQLYNFDPRHSLF